MTIEFMLTTRAGSKCELCSSTDHLSVHEIKPNSGTSVNSCALICEKCLAGIANPAAIDAKHWYCLNESMWSDHAPVKVLAYRVLKGMGNNSWAHDLLGQLYLDDETQKWADQGGIGDAAHADDDSEMTVVDSNGTPLQAGDTVTLIKDLEVKGANFTAKRGTMVKNIMLTNDPKFVEGRVNGTQIVLVAAYLKKA